MKGIYLGAFKARHPQYELVYNDISDKYGCDLVCDMLDVDLSKYDYYLCTPPITRWSTQIIIVF